MITTAFHLNYLWLPLLGLLIGLLVTMFGGGGGFFYVPILTLLFHVPTQLAVATSLAATIPTVIVGSVEHYRKGNVDLQIGLIFGVAGLIGAFAGAYLSNLISSGLLQKLFGAYAVLLTIPMVLTNRNKTQDQRTESTKRKLIRGNEFILSSFFGLLSGAMAGLFGTSGTATIVAGLYILGLPVISVIGTSVMVVLFNAISGFAGHLLVGQFDWILVVLLSAGSILGAFVGPRLLAKINMRKLEKVYGVFFILLVVGFGLAMFFK